MLHANTDTVVQHTATKLFAQHMVRKPGLLLQSGQALKYNCGGHVECHWDLGFLLMAVHRVFWSLVRRTCTWDVLRYMGARSKEQPNVVAELLARLDTALHTERYTQRPAYGMALNIFKLQLLADMNDPTARSVCMVRCRHMQNTAPNAEHWQEQFFSHCVDMLSRPVMFAACICPLTGM